jgi:hypothetical protein
MRGGDRRTAARSTACHAANARRTPTSDWRAEIVRATCERRESVRRSRALDE